MNLVIAARAKTRAKELVSGAIADADYANGKYKEDMTPDALIAAVMKNKRQGGAAMSYQEIPFEEKAVQLMPEDIRILSEYSWDMAGYTSRFGFFYQGNENADIDGLTKWQAEHIFQLTPAPPGMEDELQNMEKTRRIQGHPAHGRHLQRQRR